MLKPVAMQTRAGGKSFRKRQGATGQAASAARQRFQAYEWGLLRHGQRRLRQVSHPAQSQSEFGLGTVTEGNM